MLLREVLVEDDCRELVDCLVVVAVVVVVVLVGGTEGIVVVVVVTSVVVAVGLDIGYTVAAVDDSAAAAAAAAADSSEPTIGLVDPAPDSIADLDVDTIVVPIDFVLVVVAEHLRLYHLHHPTTYLSFH